MRSAGVPMFCAIITLSCFQSSLLSPVFLLVLSEEELELQERLRAREEEELEDCLRSWRAQPMLVIIHRFGWLWNFSLRVIMWSELALFETCFNL